MAGVCSMAARPPKRISLIARLLPVTHAERDFKEAVVYDYFLDRLLSTYCTDGLIDLSVR